MLHHVCINYQNNPIKMQNMLSFLVSQKQAKHVKLWWKSKKDVCAIAASKWPLYLKNIDWKYQQSLGRYSTAN